MLGALFSAAMSTLSSSLNSSATVIVHDLLGLRNEASRIRWVRLLTVVFCLLQVAVGIGGQWLDRSVVAIVLEIQGFTTGIVLGVFILGVATKVRADAALIGLVTGIAFMSWVRFGEHLIGMGPLQLFGQPGTLAWPWNVLIGSTATVVFGIIAAKVCRRAPPLPTSPTPS